MLQSNEILRYVLFRLGQQRNFSFHSFMFSQLNRVSRVTNTRKISVYSCNIEIPESFARKLFGHLFPRIFREPDAARLPPLAGPNFFMKIQLRRVLLELASDRVA